MRHFYSPLSVPVLLYPWATTYFLPRTTNAIRILHQCDSMANATILLSKTQRRFLGQVIVFYVAHSRRERILYSWFRFSRRLQPYECLQKKLTRRRKSIVARENALFVGCCRWHMDKLGSAVPMRYMTLRVAKSKICT